MMSNTTVDCGTRLCVLTFQIVLNCIIYTKPDHPSQCNIPCNLNDCKTEIFHDVSCPVWSCVDKPTSTTMIPPTPPTPTPTPSGSSGCSSAACITASSFASLFAVASIFFFILFIRNRNTLISLRRNLFDEETPIIRGRYGISGQTDRDGFQNIPLQATEEDETAF